MKRLCMFGVLLACFLLGCEAPSEKMLQANLSNGLVDESDERSRRLSHISNLNTRMLVDDWDFVWMYERTSSLTLYKTHVGR
ncbi:hypothetical protein LCGC14_0644630 [marine sediment metagenome]|uniref:Uncharacterized protein n=1 Tax=marine sediment metagenome TaxID=412755 RepID=A0A0F9TJV6_9ZZZZ|nr:hypothetical protein [Phycisphaerae bacterium]HDZ45257.1 hypothetical protein [Phycisphaerae bacterium]